MIYTETVFDKKVISFANMSRVSIRGRPCKIYFISTLIIMQNLVLVSHTVWTHVGGPKQISGRWGPAHLGRCRGRPPRNAIYFPTVPYKCHLTTFRHPRSNCLGVGTSVLETQAVMTTRNMLLPTAVTMSNSIMLRSTVIKEIRQKIEPSGDAFQGHSMSLE